MDYSKPEIKTDCFAYNKITKGGCRALKALYCSFEHCPFYKTAAQEEAERRRVETKYKKV